MYHPKDSLFEKVFGRRRRWYNKIFKNQNAKIDEKRWKLLSKCSLIAFDIYEPVYDLKYIKQTSFVGYTVEFIEDKLGPLTSYEFYRVIALIHKEIHQRKLIDMIRDGELIIPSFNLEEYGENRSQTLNEIRQQYQDHDGNWKFNNGTTVKHMLSKILKKIVVINPWKNSTTNNNNYYENTY